MQENLIATALIVSIVIAVGFAIRRDTVRRTAMSPEDRLNAINERDHGAVNAFMVCQHCHSRGQIRTRPVVLKKGVSGAKATAAVLTAGFSILATGLSRKENATSAWCGTCRNSWAF
jgi:hypothetical protein